MDFSNFPKAEYMLPICISTESRRGSSSFRLSTTSSNWPSMKIKHKRNKEIYQACMFICQHKCGLPDIDLICINVSKKTVEDQRIRNKMQP